VVEVAGYLGGYYDSHEQGGGVRCWMNRHVVCLNMPTLVALMVLLASSCLANAQTATEPPINDSSQETSTTSQTYNDTLRLIKKWADSEENDDLSKLLRVGDIRSSDLVSACRNSDDEIARAAFLSLQLLGKLDCEPCVESMSQKHSDFAAVCSADLTEQDFQRLDSWFARKRTSNGYECGDDYDPLTAMDDSVLYALILEGSSRSQSLLEKFSAFNKACASEGTILGDVLGQAQSLIDSAKRIGCHLTTDSDELQNSIRASAFFLPKQYRKEAAVEVIARNRARNRIVLEVSYRCGRLCGSGYYVVLRKDGNDWHYSLVRMAWIS
jgi:hypothetical protein